MELKRPISETVTVIGTGRVIGTSCLVPQETFSRKPKNKFLIDQAFSVRWVEIFFFPSLRTSTPSRSMNAEKKGTHAWSITHMYLQCSSTINVCADDDGGELGT